MWKRLVISSLISVLILLSIGSFFIVTSQSSSTVQPEGSIVVLASPVGTWQDNFNPWNAPTPADDGEWLIYELLAQVNYGTGQIIPWLATNWTWTTGYVTTANGTKIQTLALILYLRHDVYFTDGTPFNATAVWYTIALEQAYPQLGYLANYVANMTIINPYEIEIVFKPGTTHMILYTVLEQFIVDPAQWGKYFPVEQLPNGTYVGLNKTGNPYTWQDPDPIGTGPYMLYSYSPQEIVLVANPHYWMPGEPRIKYILFPAYASNVQADTALNNGQVTWAGLFEPGIQQNFVAKNPQYYHFFSPGIRPQMVVFNDLRWPLSDPVLRQAISLAINRTAICYLGEYGLEPPTPTPLPLASPMLSVLNSSVLQLAEKYAPPQGNVTAALQLLESHGYKLVNGQLIAPNGTPVPTMTIMAPAGWTDWDADLALIAQQLKQIGLNVQVETPPFSTWYSDVESGNYWMAMIWDLITGPSPIFYFQGYLYNYWNSPGNVTPIGNTTYYDLERFNLSIIHPTFEQLIQWAWGNFSVNDAVYNNIINQLAVLWIKYMPAMAVVWNAEWYEYVNNTVTGWPTPQNPYWLGAPWENLPTTPLPVVLALHLVNQSVPEPWWYYTSQVPQSWYTSNDPFVYQPTTTSTSTTTSTTTTTSTVTSVSTTSTTLTSTTTQVSTTTTVSTSTTTVTQTVTSSSSNMGLYIAIAVVVIIIVIIGVVLALRRR
ncbi:ABC transporter substrate-binding protein [Sulfolobus tengchongensis]|uniref:ABC transporter substrate-binding protein n=2 Tax=Sulfolobus tengchongensis TaxID=207809 RepID=A0AAX4L4K6_9CREN